MYFNIKCIGKLPGPTNEFEPSLVFETGVFQRPKFDCTFNSNTGVEVIKLVSCSNKLSRKFILFINVKLPKIVGILTFISRINTSSDSLKARKISVFQHFSFYEQLKFYAQLS